MQATDPGGETGSASYSWTVNAPGATSSPPGPPAPRDGYWMLRSDGKVFSFGDAFGGTGKRLPPGVAATAITPVATGEGFWVVNELGDVGSLNVPTYGGNPALHAGEKVTILSDGSAGPVQNLTPSDLGDPFVTFNRCDVDHRNLPASTRHRLHRRALVRLRRGWHLQRHTGGPRVHGARQHRLHPYRHLRK